MRYSRVMIWAAHPDDEITMAGTICKMVEEGTEVVVVQFSNGNAGFCRPEWKDTIADMRRKEAEEADRILGIPPRIMLGYDDQGVVNDRSTIQRCIQLIRKHKPEALFSHGPIDRNRDHLAVASLVEEAVWQAGERVLATAGEPWHVKHVYFYKGYGLMGPRVSIDVKKYIPTKIKALRAYASQLEMLPHLAKWCERAERQLEHHPDDDLLGIYTETFVLHKMTVLPDFP